MNEENLEVEVNDEVETNEVIENDTEGLSTGVALLVGSLITVGVAAGVKKFKKWRAGRKATDDIEDEEVELDHVDGDEIGSLRKAFKDGKISGKLID